MLAQEFARGAIQAGHNVVVVSLIGKSFEFCRGCLACQHTRKCVIDDDITKIVANMSSFDVVVFATPVYYYEMSGQMKTFIDRMNPLYDTNYNFREVYLLATAADEDESAVDGVLGGLNGWLACFDKVNLKGIVRGVGATSTGEVSKKHLQEAFEMGLRA